MSLAKILSSLPPALPRFVEPMKCRLSAKLPDAKEWVYEIKFDGYRGLAIKNKKEVHLLSRNNKDLGAKYSQIVDALGKLKCDQIVLDGEIVALDKDGRTSFQSLQRAGEARFSCAKLHYYAFDVLNVNGRNTMALPLLKRKALTKILIKDNSACIRFSDFLPGEASDISTAMQDLGLEGLIAKKRDSKCEPGQRSGAWIKFKWAQEQEFVIGGYTD